MMTKKSFSPLTHDSSPFTLNSSLLTPHFLITGGCGFIGTNLIKYLLKENPAAKIRVLDNLSVGTRDDLARVCTFSEKEETKNEKSSLINSQCELVVGDITDAETCLACCDGINIVVHLAANTGVGPSVDNPRKDMEANVIGTFNMLEAARINAVKRFIFASSGAPIGECEPPIHEEMAPHPVSPYGASKLAGEGYCSAYFRTFGLETVALRFGNVYGPGSTHKNSVVAKFVKQAIEGQPCEIYGDGNQTRDFIFIEDLVNAILKAATADVGGETFQIATNKEHTVNEVVEILKTQLQQNGINMKIVYSQPRIGDVRRNFSDTSKAERMLGWEVSIGLQERIKQTIASFLNIK